MWKLSHLERGAGIERDSHFGRSYVNLLLHLPPRLHRYPHRLLLYLPLVDP